MSASSSSSAFAYPSARRDDALVEQLHGRSVGDPYRWMEEPTSSELHDWVAAQNTLFTQYLARFPARQALRDRLERVFNYEKVSCPFYHGGRFFFFRNDGLQNQSVLYVRESIDAEPVVLLDPNVLNAAGTTALRAYGISEDAEWLAYALSERGSDWSSIRFRRVSNKEDAGDILNWVKFSGVTWLHDGSGVFYSRYREPASAVGTSRPGTETEKAEFHKLYFHRLGTAQADDVLVFEDAEHPSWMFGAGVSHDGRYVIVSTARDTAPVNRVHVAEVPSGGIVAGGEPLRFQAVVDNFDAGYDYITNVGSVFYFKSNKDAPKYKVVSVDIAATPLVWRDVVPEREDVLNSVEFAHGRFLVVDYLHDVKNVLLLFDLQGNELRPVPLPGPGALPSFSTHRSYNRIFYHYLSFTNPGSIYWFDLDTFETQLYRSVHIDGFDAGDFEEKQVFVTSADGTRVPMFIMHRKGLKLDGSNLCIVYGYGGFSISLTPYFSAFRTVPMQNMGAVYCSVNLRGGGEYGEAWHQAGCLLNKQNTFDDLKAAVQYVAANGYSRPDKIAIMGGSNGGLLVTAALTQYPELLGAAVAQVPVTDMLRFHKFTIGHAWMADYGNPDEREHFENVMKWSPLHNVRAEKAPFPALLVTTADHDDRVSPLHSFKFVATIQHVAGALPNQTQPLLTRIEVDAGHGAGKPTSKVIEEVADTYAFIALATGTSYTAE